MKTATAESESGAAGRFPLAGRPRLIVLSFLMLFVELGLIRYAAENVIYLAFFSNLVLIASFLGIGIGFLRSGHKSQSGLRKAPAALAGLVVFFVVFAAQQGTGHTTSPPVVGLFGLPAVPGWIEVPILFVAVAAVMALIAEGVGRTFAEFEPLEAYRLDILGSLGGIIVFSLMAFVGATPFIWALVTTLAFLAVLGLKMKRAAIGALAVLIVALGVLSFWPNSSWSPYYRITTKQTTPDGELAIRANGRPHQTIMPLSRIPSERPFYLYPYQYTPQTSPGRVLIIGAGSGTDVAVALSKNATSVDAVEIDPRLYQIGKALNPEHPYQDARVSVHINDGRAFLETSDQKFDLILLALPDSLTLVGGQGSLRLENYLFTTEAIQQMRDHLAPGGVFSMYNYYGPFSYARNAATVEQVFGRAPCVDLGPAGAGTRRMASFTEKLNQPLQCASPTPPIAHVTDLATDDHPFPYLPGRSIPPLYLVTIALILLVSLVAVRWSAGPLGQMRGYADLFFMGAAFLLLETKNVVQFALLFGTTWLVNALVFAGVLAAVLAAVTVARHVKFKRPWLLYPALFLALAIAWLVPTSALLNLAFWPRFGLATLLAFTPIFLANLVFAERFKDVGASTVAFGANLLGAMLGGVLEYGAMITGYRALLIIVALLYALAFLTGHRQLRSAAEA